MSTTTGTIQTTDSRHNITNEPSGMTEPHLRIETDQSRPTYTTWVLQPVTSWQLTNQFIQTGLSTFNWQQLFTWLWWWLPLRLSKRQSPLPTSVLLRTTLTRTIKPHCYPRVQTIYCISICMAPLQYVYVNIFNVSTGDKRKKKCITFLNLLQPFWNHWWSL